MIIGWILVTLALAELLIGLRLIFGYQKNQATVWYGLFAIGAAIYVASNGVGFILNSGVGDLVERFGWSGGALLTAFFLPFSESFPFSRRRWQDHLPYVIWPIVVFVPAFFGTNIFLKSQAVIHYRDGYQTTPGSLFWFFLLFFAVYWGWSLINLVRRFRTSDGLHRWQLRLILIGIAASLFFSVLFDIIMPLVIHSRFGYVGSLLTSIWLGVTSYIILKK